MLKSRLSRFVARVSIASLFLVGAVAVMLNGPEGAYAATCGGPSGSIEYGGGGKIDLGVGGTGCSEGSGEGAGSEDGSGSDSDPCTWIPVELAAGIVDPHHVQCQFDDGSLGPVVSANGVVQQAISPEEAAWQIVRSIQFEPVSIGMAPKVNPEWGHRRTYVGLPVWLWAADTTSLNFGTHSIAETIGGLTMSLEGQVDRVVWDMGDGTSVTCGAGTPYSTALGPVDSPTCGHRYKQTSENQPNGMYTVTATSYWTVAWSGGGQSGTINFELSSSTEVEVRELQSVNTGPNLPGG